MSNTPEFSTSPENPVAANAQPVPPARLPFTFIGSGSEYFRIWIINLLLSIVTLGIYSAWAKVRRLKYVYNHTHVNGASFEYHGRPMAILKGRIVALILFGGYNFAFHVSPIAGLAAFAILGLVMPWLLWNSFRFRAHNSSYCGVRFGFHGKLAGSYKTFLGIPLILMFAFWLAAVVLTFAVIFTAVGSKGLEDFGKLWESRAEMTSDLPDHTEDEEYTDESEEEYSDDELLEDAEELTEEEIDALLAEAEEGSEDETGEEISSEPDTSDLNAPLSDKAPIVAIWTTLAITAFLMMLALLYAAMHFYMKRYQHGNSHFGTASFGFYARMGAFVKAYFLSFLAGSICFAVATAITYMVASRLTDAHSSHLQMTLFFSLIPLILYLIAFAVIWPIWAALMQNTIWNNTRLEQHRFACQVPVMRMIWVHVTNFIGIICTVGLFFPFAQMRSLKVRINAMSLLPASSVDTFINRNQAEVNAIGEGAADFFDFDIGL